MIIATIETRKPIAHFRLRSLGRVREFRDHRDSRDHRDRGDDSDLSVDSDFSSVSSVPSVSKVSSVPSVFKVPSVSFGLVEKKLIKVRSTISYLRNFRYLCCMNNQRGYTPAQLSARCHEQEAQVIGACGVSKKNSINRIN